MSLARLVRRWNRFFYAPVSPVPIALFRIGFGLCVLITLLLLWPELEVWYTDRGPVPLALARELNASSREIWLAWFPTDLAMVRSFVFMLICASACLTLGLATRVMSIAVWVGVTALHFRNPTILNSGDLLLRIEGFFLMFAPAGDALSLDRWAASRAGEVSGPPPPVVPWAQRLIQLQLCLVYLCTVLFKIKGSTWAQGTALWYALHLDGFTRFPLGPLRESGLLMALLSWSTLVVEFSLGVLIWFRELRVPVIATGILFHLGIEYCMNIPVFEWIMMASLILFCEERDLPGWLVRDTARPGTPAGTARSSTPAP